MYFADVHNYLNYANMERTITPQPKLIILSSQQKHACKIIFHRHKFTHVQLLTVLLKFEVHCFLKNECFLQNSFKYFNQSFKTPFLKNNSRWLLPNFNYIIYDINSLYAVSVLILCFIYLFIYFHFF